jgi:hypothetical protein
MLSLLKANWNRQADRQAGGRAQVSIGMHAHPKITKRYQPPNNSFGHFFFFSTKVLLGFRKFGGMRRDV